MNANVFVSYASKDVNVANAMVHFLEEQKIKCWIAPRDIPGGIDYPDAIAGALKNVAVVVFICSENSLKSIWCKREIERALSYGKKIFPFKIEKAELTLGWDVLISLEHWIDAFPKPEEKFGKIVADLRKILGCTTELAKTANKFVQSLDEEGSAQGNEVALPVLGKAVDEVTLTKLTGNDAEHFKKAMGYYRVLRRRSALKELQAIENQDDPIVRYYVARFSYELDGIVSDADFEEACIKARDLGCTDAMVAFAEKHLRDIDSSFDPVSPTECIDWLRKAIAKGSTNALVALSGAYEDGNGVRKDLLLAREFLKKAVDENNIEAKLKYGFYLAGLGNRFVGKDLSAAKTMLHPIINHLVMYNDELTSCELAYLALYYLCQLPEKTDYAKGKEYCKLVAESKGHMSDCYLPLRASMYHLLGNMAVHEKDENAAIKYYEQASRIGNDGSGEYGIAYCYAEGFGVPRDEEKAIEYYQISSDKGFSEAHATLALLYLGKEDSQSKEHGKTLLKMAADGGSPVGECTYGCCLITGQYFDKDVAEGMKWIEDAAIQYGYADAMFVLGAQYCGGNEIVKADSAKAFEWFKRGADAGSGDAMRCLVLAYLTGTGTAQDMEEAKKWLTKAVDNGDAEAMCKLGTLFYNGNVVEKDVAKAIEWWTKAAEHKDDGDSVAMRNLGVIYCNGAEGVEKNLDKAVKWFTRAADTGNGYGCCVMGLHYLSLLDKDFDSYEYFAKIVTESFGDEQARSRAIRKAREMFNKAIASDDADAIGYGHLFLARIAKLQGEEETSKAHYAKAAEYGFKEQTAPSLIARILDSVSFLKKN